MSSDLEAWLEVLEQRIDAGNEERASQAAELRELRALLSQVVEVLSHRGDLNQGHRRLLTKIAARARRPPELQVKLATEPDKYQAKNSEVDCASLFPLCHSRCCTLEVRIGEQDIREGELEWDIRDPYVLPRASDGYCAYLERDSGRCGCYDVRPGPCRTYDCRSDRRIWLDFDQRIPAPMPSHVVPVHRLRRAPE